MGHGATAGVPPHIHMYPDGRMKPKDAALYTGYSIRTLARMRSEGDGPRFLRKRHRVFYFQSDLDAWLRDAPRYTSAAQARQE